MTGPSYTKYKPGQSSQNWLVLEINMYLDLILS